MGFLVVFNSGCNAIDVERLKRTNPKIATREVQALGRKRHVVAFIGSEAGLGLRAGISENYAALAGRFWLVGRIRLDGREDLRSAISERHSGREQESDA